jgi:hypothetical protein
VAPDRTPGFQVPTLGRSRPHRLGHSTAKWRPRDLRNLSRSPAEFLPALAPKPAQRLKPSLASSAGICIVVTIRRFSRSTFRRWLAKNPRALQGGIGKNLGPECLFEEWKRARAVHRGNEQHYVTEMTARIGMP